MKFGDKVEILTTEEDCYNVGDIGILLVQHPDGDWLVDFSDTGIYTKKTLTTIDLTILPDDCWYMIEENTTYQLFSSDHGVKIAL